MNPMLTAMSPSTGCCSMVWNRQVAAAPLTQRVAAVAALRPATRRAAVAVCQARKAGPAQQKAAPLVPRSPPASPLRTQAVVNSRTPTQPKSDGLNVGQLAGWVAASVGVAFAGAFTGIFINGYSTPLCSATLEGCEQIPYFMKVPLIATHLLAFILIPASMYTFFERAPVLRRWGAHSPVASLTGLAFLMVSIAGEIGWHVSQQWYYKEEYMILNFFFYFFFVLGTSLWAYGVRPTHESTGDRLDKWGNLLDLYLLAAPFMVTALYALGATVTHTKVPMYIVMSGQFATLTWRLFKLLGNDWRVFLFPFFSVGVNLGMINLLNEYKADPVLNPLFHILHDAAGTELGYAVITLLVWTKAAEELTKDGDTV